MLPLRFLPKPKDMERRESIDCLGVSCCPCPTVPDMLTGAKISSGLSVIGAIVGEFFAGHGTTDRGLGYYIILWSGPFWDRRSRRPDGI